MRELLVIRFFGLFIDWGRIRCLFSRKSVWEATLPAVSPNKGLKAVLGGNLSAVAVTDLYDRGSFCGGGHGFRDLLYHPL